MNEQMKAVIAQGGGRFAFADVPMPQPTDYQCLCKIQACATCSGTDQKIVAEALPWKQSYPGILGHESVGRVIEVGAKVRHIKTGDMFLRPAAVYNGEKLGGFHSLWGGFAEYAVGHEFKYTLDRLKGPGSWEFVFAGPDENLAHQYLLDLARLNAVPLRAFYSHRLPFRQFGEGFPLLQNKQATKIVFEMEN